MQLHSFPILLSISSLCSTATNTPTDIDPAGAAPDETAESARVWPRLTRQSHSSPSRVPGSTLPALFTQVGMHDDHLSWQMSGCSGFQGPIGSTLESFSQQPTCALRPVARSSMRPLCLRASQSKVVTDARCLIPSMSQLHLRASLKNLLMLTDAQG